MVNEREIISPLLYHHHHHSLFFLSHSHYFPQFLFSSLLTLNFLFLLLFSFLFFNPSFSCLIFPFLLFFFAFFHLGLSLFPGGFVGRAISWWWTVVLLVLRQVC